MKYIIEIEDRPMFAVNGDMLWRAKGFKSLVFDSDGLAKLQPYHQDKWSLICDAKLPGMRADKSKSAEDPLLNNSKDSVHTRLDNRLKESAQTKSDSEEYKKAAIEAAKKLANAPVDKHKTDKPEKKEESRESNLRNPDCLTFSIVDNDKFLDSIRTLIDTFF